jgi:Sec-independent protein secretion pathway component TatC
MYQLRGGYNLFGENNMQTKTIDTIVIGILFAIACFLTPQETMNENESLILLCFSYPYGFLVEWAILKTSKHKEKKDNER